jgi:ethanolamine transporter EutH
MFAGVRIAVALPMSAVFALGLSACDLSQRKPETISTMLATKRVGDSSAAAAAVEVQPAPDSTAAESSGFERSVRLYGPGVSRQRQTRI